MFSCGDYEKVKQDVWEGNWKAMRLYSVVALVAFGVITLVSVFSLSIEKYKWVYLVYTFLSLVCFCISRCQLRSFLGKELVVYSFFAALLLFGIITGTLITPEELTVNYIVFMMTAPLLFTARTAVMNGLILSSMLLYTLYRTCFLCAAQSNSIQKPSGCYSVRGAEYASDCHDDAKQAPENPVP